MEKIPALRPPVLWALYAFAATAVASIALQNFVWVAVLSFLFLTVKNREKFDWPKGLFPAATLLFLASFFLGAITGSDPANSFHTVHKYLTFLLLFFIGAMPLWVEDLKKILSVFTYGAVFCALHGIGNHFLEHQDRIYSFSGDKMVFGGMLMLALLVQTFFLAARPRGWFQWLCFALILWGLVLTETRGAWIACGVGLLILGWRAGKKWVALGLAVLVLAYFLSPPAFQDRVKSIADLQVSLNEKGEIANSSQTRLLIWLSGWNLIKDNPWGVGQGNVEKLFPRYRLGALDRYEPTVPHLHDNFLQILAQNGWIGLGAYLLWIFSFYWTAFREGFRQGEIGRLRLVLTAGFTAVLVWGLTEYTFSHQFMNIQFFLLGLQARLGRTEPGMFSRGTGSGAGSKGRSIRRAR